MFASTKSFGSLIILLLSFASVNAQAPKKQFIATPQDTLNYLIYFPADYNQQQDRVFPLVLSLHGGGETGKDIAKVRNAGIPRLIEAGQEFPFIVLAPQHPYGDQFWDDEVVMELLYKIMDEERVDKSRVYLTGFSRGGYGVWSIAMQHHEVFAALVPISGATPAPYGVWVEDIPIWVFHGVNDELIPVSESITLIDKLKSLGIQPKLTIFDGVGHNAWDPAYAKPELYEWLLEQQREF